MKEYISDSYEKTIEIAESLAKNLPKGTVIAYLGGLGMGKTAFTSGLAKGLGITCDVTSPTFALCNTYKSCDTVLHHFDMYRVDGWDDLYSTGFYDFLGTDAYIAVEWSENIYAALPPDTVIAEFEKISDNVRHIKIYRKYEAEQ